MSGFSAAAHNRAMKMQAEAQRKRIENARWGEGGEVQMPYWEFMRSGPEKNWDVYMAGSLRNPAIPSIAKELGLRIHSDRVFCDWYAAGPEADDYWKAFYTEMGHNYKDALKEPSSVNVFNFDKKHMEDSKTMVLCLPAGKSGHLELGWFLGRGGSGYILLDSAEDRWDVMYQFATGVTADMEELAEWLKKDLSK